MQQLREVMKKVYDNSVKIIEKKCKKCGSIFQTKSGITGYENCKDCNSKLEG